MGKAAGQAEAEDSLLWGRAEPFCKRVPRTGALMLNMVPPSGEGGGNDSKDQERGSLEFKQGPTGSVRFLCLYWGKAHIKSSRQAHCHSYFLFAET